jgi:hypothetical protein
MVKMPDIALMSPLDVFVRWISRLLRETIMVWFKPFGPVFRPVSIAGWLLTLLALGFCLQVFLVVDGKSHSVSDTFYGVFPYWVPTFLGWIWIAKRTADGRGSGISR